jgi:hypothetical protein
MTQILHNTPHPGSLYAGGAAPEEAHPLKAGDILVFDGASFQVLAAGRLSLADGAVEVVYVQPGAQEPGRHTLLEMPALLARQLAAHLGIAEGERFPLHQAQVEQIHQTLTDYKNLLAGAAFVQGLTGGGDEAPATP